MSVNEVLQALGSWELRLKESTPDYVISQLEYFGHVAIVDGPVDVEAAGNGLLAGARYVGVCREKDHPGDYVRGGDGLVYWLGDEDGKGHTILSQITLTNATLAQVVAALKPPTVTTGTVHPQADPATRYTGKHVFQSRREALAIALAPFGAEVRVNPDFSIDVGTAAQLYATATPDTIIKRRAVGSDVDLTAIGGDFDTSGSAVDYSTDITLLGQTIGTGGEPDTVFATGAISASTVPWKDPQGNQLKLTRLISESGETTGSVASRAQLQLNRFNRTTSSVKVTADDFEIQGTFTVGDATYVYDPDTGIVNPALEVFFAGEKLNPDIVRVTGRSWPIVEGMTVAWRTDAGVWLDLTPWVVWETAGSHELTVGDLPKTLLRSGTPNGAVQDRVDAARGNPSTKVPKTPAGLTLSTSSTPNLKGRDASVITATWSAVTQYVDNTTVALHHYELQYRPQFRSPQWTASALTSDLTADLPVTAALAYDVQVRAVSTGGIASAWSSTQSITSAADSTGPAAPADPVVSQYLGLLRVYWNGLTSVGGAMPSDFNRVDVHVGTSSGFTASASTLVDSLSAAGYSHVQAPYGSTRWVRFIPYDHNGNAGTPSATVSGATTQVADGDVASMSVGKLTAGTMSADVVIAGRFATALTGQRREVNAVGFQAFNASNVLTVSIDGVNNLLTGIFKTALTGRRIEIGSGASLGDINFYAPDGTNAVVRAFTSSGIEAVQMSVPKTGVASAWNGFQVQSDENIYMVGRHVQFFYGGGSGTQAVTFTHTANKLLTTNVTRFSMDPDSSSFWVPNSGNFYIFDVGELQARFWIDGDGGNGIYHSHGQAFRIGEWVPGNIAVDRLVVSDSQVNFNWPGTSARTEIIMSGFSDRSTTLVMTKSDNYGTRLYHKSVPGTGASHRLEFRDAGDSIYEDLWAASFAVASSRRWKSDIRDAPDPSAILRRIRPVVFKRQLPQPDGDDGPVAYEDDDTLGVVAEELPDELRVDGPDGSLWKVGPTVVAAVAMLQRLDARLDKLEGK